MLCRRTAGAIRFRFLPVGLAAATLAAILAILGVVLRARAGLAIAVASIWARATTTTTTIILAVVLAVVVPPALATWILPVAVAIVAGVPVGDLDLGNEPVDGEHEDNDPGRVEDGPAQEHPEEAEHHQDRVEHLGSEIEKAI